MDEQDKDGPETGCGSQVAPIHTEKKPTFDGQLLCASQRCSKHWESLCHLSLRDIPAREVAVAFISLVVESESLVGQQSLNGGVEPRLYPY